MSTGGTAIRSRSSVPTAGTSTSIVRALAPGAQTVDVVAREDSSLLGRLELAHPGGLFAGPVVGGRPYVLRVAWPNAVQETEDPYSFDLLLGDLDLHLIGEGTHYELGRCLGAQAMTIGGVEGVRFAVWAPNARRVSVVGSFNTWDGRRHPMRLRHEAGVWELFVPAHRTRGALQIRDPRSRRSAAGAEGRSSGARKRGLAGHLLDRRLERPFRLVRCGLDRG